MDGFVRDTSGRDRLPSGTAVILLTPAFALTPALSQVEREKTKTLDSCFRRNDRWGRG